MLIFRILAGVRLFRFNCDCSGVLLEFVFVFGLDPLPLPLNCDIDTCPPWF